MGAAINTEGRLSRLEGRVDEALSHMATKADSAELKADIAELRGTLRILIALNIGIALAILSMLVGWLPAGAA
ncbi:MAG: hypothetical protein OXI40_01960 [Chloroflexota bacterium]|nr:hypothetical protein [Chloroflexota bacterium]